MSKENQPSGNKIADFFKALGADLADIGTTFVIQFPSTKEIGRAHV